VAVVFEYRQESEGELPTGDVNVQMAFVANTAGGEITTFSVRIEQQSVRDEAQPSDPRADLGVRYPSE